MQTPRNYTQPHHHCEHSVHYSGARGDVSQRHNEGSQSAAAAEPSQVIHPSSYQPCMTSQSPVALTSWSAALPVLWRLGRPSLGQLLYVAQRVRVYPAIRKCTLQSRQDALFVCLVFDGTFSTYRLCRAIGVWNIYCVGPGRTHSNKQTKQKKNTHKYALPPGLCGDNLLTSRRCHQRGLSIANHLASTDN